MRTLKTIAAGLLALRAAVPAGAQGIDGTRLAFSDCPVNVREECSAACGGSGGTASGGTAGTCRWPEFSCAFQICWGTRHHTILEELATALGDPATYRLPSGTPVGGGINYVALIRLVNHDTPGLFLLRGRFILEVPILSRAAGGRALIQWAQACARDALINQEDLIERSEASATPFRVSTCEGGVRVAAVSGLTSERPAGGGSSSTATPPPTTAVPGQAARPGTSGGAGGSSGGSGGGGSGPGDLRARERELETFLEGSGGGISVDGNRILVNGVNPFSAHTDPEAQMEALSGLSPEQLLGMKDLNLLIAARTESEAARAHPPGSGERYVYDPETGRAERRAIDEGVIRAPSNQTAGPDSRGI
jgi:hypothetical protein